MPYWRRDQRESTTIAIELFLLELKVAQNTNFVTEINVKLTGGIKTLGSLKLLILYGNPFH